MWAGLKIINSQLNKITQVDSWLAARDSHCGGKGFYSSLTNFPLMYGT